MKQSKFLQTGLEAVNEASKIILKYYNNLDLEDVEIKKDGSPVTIADKKAEQLIKKIILDEFPDHSFIGEEGSDIKNKSEYTWILDPIDGTRYFTSNMPFFTTELALIKNGEPIIGISHNPSANQTLTAIKNQGAYLNTKTKLQVSSATELKKVAVSAGSLKYFQEHNQLENLAKLNWDISQLRGLEESRMNLLLAQGILDCIMIPKGWSWDFAAVYLILKEAGAEVTNLFGEKLDFNSKEPQSMLAANKVLHSKIVKYFTQFN